MNTLKFGNSEWYGTEGNILAYNDENGNFKPLPFDFSRGSIATRVNQQGLIETVGANDARVDYLDNANGALLLEPSRTNLAIQSSIKNMGGSSSNSGVVQFGNLSNGLESAELTVSGQRQWYFSTANIVAGTEYTVSFYVDSFDLSSSVRPIFYLPSEGTNGAASIYGSQIVLGRNEKTFTATANGSQFRIGLGTSSNDTGYIKLGGLQIEEGSYPTSYIPTQGTAQTRLEDSCFNTSNNINNFGTSNFSLLIECYIKEGYNTRIKKMQSWTSRGFAFYVNAYGLRGRVYGDSQIDTNYVGIGSVINNSKNKALMVVDRVLNTITIYLNGVNIHSQSIASISGDSLDNTSALVLQKGINTEAGFIDNFRIYNTALSSTEAIALTQV